MKPRLLHLPLVLLCAGVLAGCGTPGSATYVDPNDDALFSGGGAVARTTEPFTTYGADVAQRALALVRLRGSLETARVLQPTDPDAARQVVERALEDDLPVIEPLLVLRAPRVDAEFRAHLVALAKNPPRDLAGYAANIQRTANVEVTRVNDIVVPIAARQDPAFRAAIMIESINDASVRYGNAVEGGLDRSTSLAEYRTAYGILLDLRTRGLDAITIDDRVKVQMILTTTANRTFPTPSLPRHPVDATTASIDMSTAADFITISTGADTTLPTPDAAAPEQWRQLKRNIAAALEMWSRGDTVRARNRLHATAIGLEPSATASLATVDPDRLVSILRQLDIELPAELRDGGAPEPAAARLDADIDSAVTAIEHELALIRQEDDGS